MEVLQYSWNDLDLKLVFQTGMHKQNIVDLGLSMSARQISNAKLSYQIKYWV